MEDDVLIDAQAISKKYCRQLRRSMIYGIRDITSDLLGRAVDPSLREDEFWAVQSISFSVRRGECLGIMGANGAGKSTLLKLLNGIFLPDLGTVRTQGQIGALIEVGAGFHPLLSGRENIYLNGSILGMSRAHIQRKFRDIVEFSELGRFIDAPVKTYSSGMHVRLGFSIAVHASPDILLIDEVLAVGDSAFRAKCFNRIHELAKSAALVFVSHFTPHVARLCDRVLVLDNGTDAFYGSTIHGIQRYQELLAGRTPRGRHGNGDIQITVLRFRDAMGCETSRLCYNAPASIEIELESRVDRSSIVLDLAFRSFDDDIVAELNNYVTDYLVAVKAGEKTTITVAIDALLLNPGTYNVSAFVLSDDMTLHYDWIEHVTSISVHGARPATAGVQLAARWTTNRDHGDTPELSSPSAPS